MTIQNKLYSSAQRKLVLWCITAMLLMSTSFIVAAYLVATMWLGHSADDMRQAQHSRLDLMLALVAVQGLVLAIGVGLSFWFARRVLRPIRRAHQAQADFAANAHHQLRTPIAVMQTEVDAALLRKDQRPGDYKRVLKSLLDELRLLRTTSEQLLLYADGVPAPISSAKSHSTSEDLGAILPMLERLYGVTITTVISTGLRTTLSNEELALCLEILLDNTKKHAGHHSQDLQVHVAMEGYGNTARLTYRDNGRGVFAGEEARIFERRVRGKQALESKVEGNGLGLAILADIIKTHAGTLTATAVPTGGLQIVATIPVSKQ